MSSSIPQHIQHTYLRLKPDGMVDKLQVDTGFWQRLINGEHGSFSHEYLVSSHTYEKDWEQWEIHPHGDEVVMLLAGRVDFLLELPDGIKKVELRHCGQFALVPKACWHTADVHSASSMLFITPGEGTRGRPREPASQ